MISKKLKPQLSVIIPCLNEEGILKNLLDDLSQQTYPLFETIIVDGGSTDKTLNEIKPFQSKLAFKILQSDKANVSHQRNIGSQHANTDWLVFMDADIGLPKHFLQGIKYRIDSSNSSFLTTFINSDSNNKKDKAITSLVNIYMETQKRTSNPSALESMLVCKAKEFNNLHGFNVNIAWGEGGELLRRAKKKDYKLSVYRTPSYQYSMRRIRKDGSLKVARLIAQVETARLLGMSVSQEKVKELYPMNGGAYHEKDNVSQSYAHRLLGNIKRIKTIPENLKSILKQNL